MSSAMPSGRKMPRERESSENEAAQLDLLRQRAAERKGELASEEDLLRRERRNLMSAKKRAERGEADLVTKLERLEREVQRLSQENARLMSQADSSRRRVLELEADSKSARNSPSKSMAEPSPSEETAPPSQREQLKPHSATEAQGKLDEAKERHVLDLEQQTKHFEEVRENDMRNFRIILKEEREKVATLEAAWRGVLGGTHDADIKCSTQRLSTGRMLMHITCATVRETGKAHGDASSPRKWDDMSVIDRMGLRGRMRKVQLESSSEESRAAHRLSDGNALSPASASVLQITNDARHTI